MKRAVPCVISESPKGERLGDAVMNIGQHGVNGSIAVLHPITSRAGIRVYSGTRVESLVSWRGRPKLTWAAGAHGSARCLLSVYELRPALICRLACRFEPLVDRLSILFDPLATNCPWVFSLVDPKGRLADPFE